MKKHIFVFFGEFGYELLNWHGAIRKFSKEIDKKKEKIICCSRANLYQLYKDFAEQYIDMSSLYLFKKSVACMYWGLDPEYKDSVGNYGNKKFQEKLIKQVTNHIIDELYSAKNINFSSYIIYKIFRILPSDCNFVFSCFKTNMGGVNFGLSLKHEMEDLQAVDIYSKRNTENNIYKKLEPELSEKEAIEKELGFTLDEPYVLCQTGNREIIKRSKDEFDKEDLIAEIAKNIKVILLQFESGRNLDSYSKFKKIPENCYIYNCSSFPSQSCLIHFAKSCLFFTEGDFRSHNYVPPFFGKNVFAVAPASVFALGTSPIEMWNDNIFKFNGKIIKINSEDIQQDKVSVFKDKILGTLLETQN